MKKVKVVEHNDSFEVDEELSKNFEDHLQVKLKVDHKLDSNELKDAFTYGFAMSALKNDSPVQLINIIANIKKRYAFKLTSEASGFLDCIMAKGYAYMCINNSNLYLQEDYYKKATELFKYSYKKGYKPSIDAALEFKDKYLLGLETNNQIISKVDKKIKNHNESNFAVANMFFTFNILAEDAIRVLNNRRPYISSMDDFNKAKEKIEESKDVDCKCGLAYGLFLIVDGKIQEGTKYVNKNLESFIKEVGDPRQILFDQDATEYEKAINALKEKFLTKTKSR